MLPSQTNIDVENPPFVDMFCRETMGFPHLYWFPWGK